VIEVDVKKQQGDFTVDAAFSTDATGVTALFGISGAGKTSVINMVAGLSRPDSGRITIKGRTVFDSKTGIDLPPEKRGFGYVFQDGRIFPHRSVRSNLTYGMELVPKHRRSVGFEEVIELLGIGDLQSRRVTNLSAGEKQRVAIGRALLTSPSLLLMDEPLASLDAARKAEVLPFIQRLSHELSIPILYVSHSLDEVLNLASTLVLLDSGSVVSVGPVEEIANQPRFADFKNGHESGAVLVTVVDHHDADEGLTYLRLDGKLLKVPLYDAAPGTRLRVHINSRDVALALHAPTGTSVQNILPAVVDRILEHEGALVDVRLDMGTPITARITRKARRDLALFPGQQVLVMIKSVAVSRGAIPVAEVAGDS
jgi:molybdate transport system ATP-binding protein